jgi:hypothetical protein
MLGAYHIPPHRRDVPVSTVRYTADDGNERHAVFCPWCEDIHHHGATGGRRAAGEHCHATKGSPLQGYQLKPVAEGRTPRDAMPKAPFAKDGGLVARFAGERLRNLRKALAAIILRTDLKVSPTVRPLAKSARFRMKQDWGANAAAWEAIGSADGQVVARGNDLLEAAQYLYGPTVGIAAVRTLEAATGARLDAEAALAVSYAIDQWRARGSPRGTGRRF